MFSSSQDVPFAFESLAREGFMYDSSIFPFGGSRYGGHRRRLFLAHPPAAQRTVRGPADDCRSARAALARAGRRRLFAATPFFFSDWAVRQRIRTGIPAVAYFHPWEFSSEGIMPGVDEVLTDPRTTLKLAWYTLARVPGRGPSMLAKLDRLLRKYAFEPLRDLVEASAFVPWRIDHRSGARLAGER